MKNLKNTFAAAAVILMLCSCAVKQNVKINMDKQGDVKVEVELHPVFVKYIVDLSETTGKNASAGIFNTENILEALDSYEGIEPITVKSPEMSKLIIELKTKDYSAILPEKYTPFLKVSDSGKERTVSFYLGKENYAAIDKLFGISSNPVLSGLSPQPDNPYSKDEYRSLLEYVFADYLDKPEDAGKLLDDSFVQIEIKTDGKILASDTGTFSGNRIRAKLPLIDFLTLEKPVKFSFKYSI